MAVVAVTMTKEQNKQFEYWKTANGAEVLKDFTYYSSNHDGKFVEIKKGTKSFNYQPYYFDFRNNKGDEISINISSIGANKKYFKKI